jgi:DNA-directed RNA polymerase specialized sigma24 family protein
MEPIPEPENPDYRVALQQAQNAANKGDAWGMFNALPDSLIFDSYQNYFSSKYPTVDESDLQNIIGKATDQLYDRITRKEKIRKIESYLWKIIDAELWGKIEEQKRFRSVDVEAIGINDNSIPSALTLEQKAKQKEYALALADSLVPRLGQVNVQNVMRYILGCIRNGVQDINSNDIGEALDMKPATVRQFMKRGFERLTRICKEESLVDASYIFPFEEMEYYLNGQAEQNESENVQ